MQKDKVVDLRGSESVQWGIITKTLAKIGLILLAFVPLLFDSNIIFPYISEKMIAVRIAITLVLLLISLSLIVSQHFRRELYSKVDRLIHNPIFITTGIFILTVGLSAVFAVDKYRAFWGNVERAEGLVGILSYFAFFPLAYLVFSRRDWMWFFKASMASGLVLFINEVMSLPADPAAVRPGSFTGNPSFLAGYFLFVILSALIVFYDSRKDALTSKVTWRIGSGLMVLLSIIGIFLTQTRGTILGLGAGFVLLALYWAIKGKGVKLYRKMNLRTASLILIALLVIFIGFFFVTKSDSFWQSVPGMGRFTNISLSGTNSSNDSAIQTRLISTGIGFKAINPVTNGYMRFVFGWGQENFDIAYNKYYNPKYFEFEQEWFDRAHDKVMDVLVMNGALGLLSYLTLWITFVWVGFKKKEFSFEKMAVLFFGIAFFVNLLTLFDQVSTYIPLFAALGFMAYLYDEEHHESMDKVPSKALSYVLYTAIAVILAFFIYVLSVSLISYSQMRQYIGLLESGNVTTIENGISGAFSPYTYAQQDIRGDFVSEISQQYASNQDLKPLLDEAIGAEEQVINLDPWDPRQSLIIGQAYDMEGRIAIESTSTGVSAQALTYFQNAEQYYRAAYKLAPERQDVLLPLAQNLVYQGRMSEALTILEQCYQEDPKVPLANYELGFVFGLAGQNYYAQAVPLVNFALNSYASNIGQLGNTDYLIKMYDSFASYFYNQKDSPDFIMSMQGLSILQPSNAANFEKAAGFAQSGNWAGIK